MNLGTKYVSASTCLYFSAKWRRTFDFRAHNRISNCVWSLIAEKKRRSSYVTNKWIRCYHEIMECLFQLRTERCSRHSDVNIWIVFLQSHTPLKCNDMKHSTEMFYEKNGENKTYSMATDGLCMEIVSFALKRSAKCPQFVRRSFKSHQDNEWAPTSASWKRWRKAVWKTELPHSPHSSVSLHSHTHRSVARTSFPPYAS